MIKYRNIQDNKLTIFDNIIVNNGIITAYYVLFPYNYDIMDGDSIERHIEKLYNVINNLYSITGELKFSLFKLRNIVSREETIQKIINTIRKYKPEYKEFPDKYKKFIKNISKDFVILAININLKNNVDIENQSIKNIIKDVIDNSFKAVFSTNTNNIDENAISQQNIRLKHTLQRYAVPASQKLVMNIYVNSIFPSYNLIYNDFFLNHESSILGNIKQEIIPHLGWFEMSNSGIEIFGATPRVTYGSVLTILEFPDAINTKNFNIAMPGLRVNLNCLQKDKAILKFKRIRADAREELEEVEQTDALDSNVEKNLTLVQRAIDDVMEGRIASELDANILLTANTKEELDQKKKNVISILSDVGVVVSIAADQGKTFVDSFIKNYPNNYYHVLDLEYALSFQLDNGLSVGDGDSNFASPVIGIGGS